MAHYNAPLRLRPWRGFIAMHAHRIKTAAWPIDAAVAYRDWQPAEPSPIVKMMLEQRRAQAQQRRE